MRNMLLVLPVLLAACHGRPVSAGEHIVYHDVAVPVAQPCPVARPARPGPLARPLPDDPGALVSLLVAKLKEYAGPGGYAERADAALAICTRATN